MEFRLFDSSKINSKWILGFIALSLSFLFSGCLEKSPNTNSEFTARSSRVPSSALFSGSENDAISFYRNAISVKSILNKKSFYNNTHPNTFGCAGDAKTYYDPRTDRAIPTKPDWLKNISVDITNSNSLYGPSNAAGCSLSGSTSPLASACALFDDLQPLDGAYSRSILIGGIGCDTSTAGCDDSDTLDDIWTMFTTTDTSAFTFNGQVSTIPTSVAWASGDYDELHDEFFLYGGTQGTIGSTFTFSSNLVKISFNTDGSVSTSPAPANQTLSGSLYYGSWINSNSAPPALVGHSFTYGLRRDETTKSWNQTSNGAYADNEHSDYYLLIGGMSGTTAQFSSDIYMYKPHSFSNDISTSSSSGGDWNQLSNNTSAGIRGTIMSIVDVSTTGNTSTPFQVTTVGNAVPTGSAFSGFQPRAFHRTVYDPEMNRFYIYGGLTLAAGSTASANTPSLSSETWIYDPPALGRRPTSACFSTETPDSYSLPSYAGAGAAGTYNLKINQEYVSNKMVFPPGGCLQRMGFLADIPEARFEHSMAFDRDHKGVLLFGGCDLASTIAASGSQDGGDPSSNCDSSASMFSDTWVYIPPTTTEYVSSTTTTTTSPHPYNESYPYKNIFGTDFWLNFQPTYIENDVYKGGLNTPTRAMAMGGWIRLYPATKPTPRYSANLVYDRSRQKFYLFGGYGCLDQSCSVIQTLNDLWEFTPPDFAMDCSPGNGTCVNQGYWTQIRSTKADTLGNAPSLRRGAIMAYGNPQFTFGDGFYTALDLNCVNQGPLSTLDPSVSKQYVGGIYIDIDREQFSSKENLLVNLKLLAFNDDTKLPGYFDSGTPSAPSDDTDAASSDDQAVIRVQLLHNPLSTQEQIQASIQPRFHEFITGTPILGDNFYYVSGSTGQLSEKQILIPLSLDPSINLIKIERVQGSVKFFEVTVSKF
ncbi:MAG: hypothetical protein AB7F43_06305 [Bacteriovoracia bacterium]